MSFFIGIIRIVIRTDQIFDFFSSLFNIYEEFDIIKYTVS